MPLDFKAKRTADTSLEEVRRSNREWWQSNPMTYDWRGRREALAVHSPEWFERIDRDFLAASTHLSSGQVPFDRVIPLEQLAGKRVLEIGCGMGLHTKLMAKAGARVVAIDLTDYAVETTRHRLQLAGLEAEVRSMNAEELEFDSASFDFVWSWGVIHHTASTSSVVRQIARVLKPDGQTRVMVYNRDSMAVSFLVLKALFRMELFRRSLDEILWARTDGFHARYYTRDQFEDLFRAFFQDADCRVTGQRSDGVPLPRRARLLVEPLISERTKLSMIERHGSFLFLTAGRPRI